MSRGERKPFSGIDALANLIYIERAKQAEYKERVRNDMLNLTRRIFNNEDPDAHSAWVTWMKSNDYCIAMNKHFFSSWEEQGVTIPDDKLYRVVIDGSKVLVLCFGMDLLDPQAEGEYDSVDDLPKWVQDRLAVLMLMDFTPPTVDVAGVGRRIEENVYWIYAD
jgi:hypothetical protein